MILSIIFSVRGIYFYVVYGNCNGQNSDQFCVFDALNPKQDTSVCQDPSLHKNGNFTFPSVDDDPFIGPKGAKVTIIEFGCFSCPYTKQAEPIVKEILNKYQGRIRFVYRDFRIANHPGAEIRAMAAECANEQDKYWEYHDILFERQEEDLTNDTLVTIAVNLGLNKQLFSSCLNSEKYRNEVDKDFNDGLSAGVYGTPTFFINNEVVVGPKPFRYFKNIIDNQLN
jgi:protein-disulfide isomerase